MWLLGVSRGDTWLFLPDLVEVRDVGSCVMRLWSHAVALVFRELLGLGGCVSRVASALFLIPLVLRESWLAFQLGPSGVSLLDVCLALCACAPLGAVLCSVGIFARAKQMLVCRVAPLVERCDTCLWLLPGLCWLVVNSGEVLPEFFFVGSGGGEVFPRTVLRSFL
ncbi:hypothetical protein Taro_014951, partial [Colocasia esculenta]|nr:hypothetical protein [Colocasia esculenta]